MKEFNCPDCGRTDSCDGCYRVMYFPVNTSPTFKNSSCKNCSNNPANGGNGICYCVLGHWRKNDTADAVRCKDCKWSREQNEKEKIYLVNGVVICTNPEVSENCWSAVWETEFCACGESKK